MRLYQTRTSKLRCVTTVSQSMNRWTEKEALTWGNKVSQGEIINQTNGQKLTPTNKG